MTGFLLDTNVLSEFSRRGEPDARVKRWLTQTEDRFLFTSVGDVYVVSPARGTNCCRTIRSAGQCLATPPGGDLLLVRGAKYLFAIGA